MFIDLTEVTWLSDSHMVSYDELTELSGLTISDIQQLLDNGALTPQENNSNQFNSTSIILLRKVSRLKEDFELDINGMCISLALLQKIYSLEQQIKSNKSNA
ncbi:MAG: hypothetical protein H0W85_05870 [Methylotenera sp.]|nr:hypothetical protein [Methylotenera sp.]